MKSRKTIREPDIPALATCADARADIRAVALIDIRANREHNGIENDIPEETWPSSKAFRRG